VQQLLRLLRALEAPRQEHTVLENSCLSCVDDERLGRMVERQEKDTEKEGQRLLRAEQHRARLQDNVQGDIRTETG